MDPIQLDPNHSKNTLSDSTLEQAQLNTRFGVQSEVDKWNASKAADYEVQWLAYKAARDARPDATNLIQPMPPQAEMGMVDERGWPYIVQASMYVSLLHTYVSPGKSQGGYMFGGGTGPQIGFTAGELLAGKLYGEPLAYGRMKFLRVE